MIGFQARLLEDSFDAMALAPLEYWVRDIFVIFEGEPGIDYGALTRDWLVKLAEALSKPEAALFTTVSSAQLAHPYAGAAVQPNYLGYVNHTM